MQKPAVKMHEMAMNESIATTCCYVWNGTFPVSSVTYPHGGRINQVNETKYYYSMPGVSGQISSIWLSGVGIHPRTQTGVDETYAVWRDPDDKEWYVLTSAGEIRVTTGEGAAIDNTVPFARNYRKGKITSTKYYTRTTEFKYYNHSRSTSPHSMYTLGNNWLADHQAYQYSS